MSILDRFDVVELVDPFGTLHRDFIGVEGRTGIIEDIWDDLESGDMDDKHRVVLWHTDETMMNIDAKLIETEFGQHEWTPSYLVSTMDAAGKVMSIWVSEEEVAYMTGRESRG